MKYYSQETHKLYNTEAELNKAEAEIKEAEAKAKKAIKERARASRAKEVEKALKEANEAQAKAIQLLRDFTKDYGYFHMSYSTEDAEKQEKNAKKDLLSDFHDIINYFLI